MSTQTKTIKVVVDTTTARAQIDALSNSIRGVNSATITTASGASRAASGISSIGASANNSAGGLSNLGSQLGNVRNGLGGLNGAISGATGGLRGLGSSFAGLGSMAAVGGAAVATAVVAIGVEIFKATAAVQTFKASLQGVLGDSRQAGEAFGALAAFAAKTPFSLEQAVTGFTKLRALGLEPSQRSMTSYGNTAAAMGKDLNQMIEAVADASTGEFERLKEFGIRSKSEGDKVSFTFQGVTTTVGKNSKEIQDYLRGIGETKFAGAMDVQAKTISGSLSTLTDSIFLMFASLGEGQFAETMVSGINALAEGITRVQPMFRGIMDAIGGIMSMSQMMNAAMSGALRDIFGESQNVGTVFEWIGVVFSGLGSVFQVVGGIMAGTITTIGAVARGTADMISGAFQWAFGSASQSSAQSAKSMDKDSAWASTRLIDRVRGYVTAFSEFGKRIPTMFKIAISAVGSMFDVLGVRFNKLITGDFTGAFAGIGAELGAIAAKAGGAIGAQANAAMKAGRAAGFQSYADSFKKDDVDLGKFGIESEKPKPSVPKAGGAGPKAGGVGATGPTTDYEGDLAKYLKSLTDAANTKELINQKSAFEVTLTEQLAKATETAHRALTTGEQERVRFDLQRKANAEGISSIVAETSKLQLATSRDLDSAMNKALYGEKEGEKITRNRLALESMIADLKAKGARLDDKEIAAKIEGFKAMQKAQDNNSLVLDLANSAPAAKMTAKAANDNLAMNRGAITEWMNAQNAATQAGVEGEAERERIRALGTKAMDGAFEKWRQDVEEAGSSFKKATDMLVDGVSSVFGSRAGAAVGGLTSVIDGLVNGKKNTDNPQSAIGKITKSLQVSVEGLGTKIPKGIGEALGKLTEGAETGDQIANIGQLFSKKFSRTGSQAGGALGNLVGGPVGGLIGSIAGGIIGGLLKKTKNGYAVVSNSGVTGGGNSDELKQATMAAGTGLQESISKMASSLGGTVGNYNVSLGKRSSGWIHVDGAGASNVGDKNWIKKSSQVVYNGKDEAEALRLALRNAIEDGAIAGIRASTKRLVLAGKDVDAQLSKAVSFENAFKELGSLIDPVGAGISAFNKEMQNLKDIFKEAGASSEEMASLEQLRSLKTKKLLEESLSGLNDFRKELFGEGSGVTKYNQFVAKQSEFAGLKALMDSGQTVDQSKFTGVGQELFGLAAEVFGTSTSQFQAIRAELVSLTDGMISKVTNQYEQAAVEAQREIANNTALAADYLAQLVENSNKAIGNTSSSSQISVNGSLVASQYR